MRNALSYIAKAQQSVAAAALRQTFIQPDLASASQALRRVAGQLRDNWPKLGKFIHDSETDVLAHMDLPTHHRTWIHFTKSPERVKRRSSGGLTSSGFSQSRPQSSA